jgi:hypothetical protein
MFDSLHIVESVITAEAEIEEVAFWVLWWFLFSFPWNPNNTEDDSEGWRDERTQSWTSWQVNC